MINNVKHRKVVRNITAEEIKQMKRNRPDLYGQFLFGITIAALSIIQSVVLVLVLICA